MAILHIQYQFQTTRPDGTVEAGLPSIGLQQRGPVVQVSLGLAQSLANPLAQQGVQVPTPLGGFALIDTGASNTCIDETAAQKLGLPAVDVVQMTSASHVGTPANVYPARIELLAGATIVLDVDRAIGASLASQGLLVLIGRDFLQHCTVFYNGIAGQITLSAG